jgi:hypothetical protein
MLITPMPLPVAREITPQDDEKLHPALRHFNDHMQMRLLAGRQMRRYRKGAQIVNETKEKQNNNENVNESTNDEPGHLMNSYNLI